MNRKERFALALISNPYWLKETVKDGGGDPKEMTFDMTMVGYIASALDADAESIASKFIDVADADLAIEE